MTAAALLDDYPAIVGGDYSASYHVSIVEPAPSERFSLAASPIGTYFANLSESPWAGSYRRQQLELVSADRRFFRPIRSLTDTIVDRFNTLAEEWRDDTAFTSSVNEMVSHPAYLKIVAMGTPVVPLLLQSLANEPNHWFTALLAITGVDPVEPADYGRMDVMAQAWLEWGRSQDLI